LEQIGLDVVSSGAAEDTPETYAAAVAAVPHRPVKAMGHVPGVRIVECDGDPPAGAHRLHLDEIVVVNPTRDLGDANDVARFVLAAVADGPSTWWIAARGLAEMEPAAAIHILETMVEGVRHVRLFLAKQQFD
jgi:hypothetical protein